MQNWQMQDAKVRLSEVLKEAERRGPQPITVHGQPTAVVLSKLEVVDPWAIAN